VQLTIEYHRLLLSDFGPEDRQLYDGAKRAMAHAHAPYSKFTVASAILFEDGQIVTGNNQENAAYPSGLCAERVALFKGKSDGLGAIATLLVMARNDEGVYCETFPCGGCRQVLMEYATQQQRPIRILMQSDEKSFFVLEDARMLLPFGFTKDAL